MTIAQLATKHGVIPLKKYGQNFIFDESLCDKIVRVSKISVSSDVLEIGPGPAGLTRAILKYDPRSLRVIETDQRCLPLLEEMAKSHPSLQIIHNDALLINLSQLNSDKLDIVANLPYNIGSRLLINWLYQIERVNSMTLMLQKEVVDRIVAIHNNKIYGRLSIFCQIFCDVEKCFDVSPKAFYPEPKIWSSIVRLAPKDVILDKHILSKLEKITHHAFAARRKMIKSSLGKIIFCLESLLAELNIDPSLRAENVSPQDYLKIAKFADLTE